jgi:hypothetical protein
MKKMSVLLMVINLLCASMAFAGGVTCKECPSETSACAPMPGCHEYLDQVEHIQKGHCPLNSSLNCKGKKTGSACGAGGEAGVCELTSLMAGGFCMCDQN